MLTMRQSSGGADDEIHVFVFLPRLPGGEIWDKQEGNKATFGGNLRLFLYFLN